MKDKNTYTYQGNRYEYDLDKDGKKVNLKVTNGFTNGKKLNVIVKK